MTDTPRRRDMVLDHGGSPLAERAYGAVPCILHDGCPDRMRCFLAGHCLDIAPAIWPPRGERQCGEWMEERAMTDAIDVMMQAAHVAYCEAMGQENISPIEEWPPDIQEMWREELRAALAALRRPEVLGALCRNADDTGGLDIGMCCLTIEQTVRLVSAVLGAAHGEGR